jgi:hypothetical protein
MQKLDDYETECYRHAQKQLRFTEIEEENYFFPISSNDEVRTFPETVSEIERTEIFVCERVKSKKMNSVKNNFSGNPLQSSVIY